MLLNPPLRRVAALPAVFLCARFRGLFGSSRRLLEAAQFSVRRCFLYSRQLSKLPQRLLRCMSGASTRSLTENCEFVRDPFEGLRTKRRANLHFSASSPIFGRQGPEVRILFPRPVFQKPSKKPRRFAPAGPFGSDQACALRRARPSDRQPDRCAPTGRNRLPGCGRSGHRPPSCDRSAC